MTSHRNSCQEPRIYGEPCHMKWVINMQCGTGILKRRWSMPAKRGQSCRTPASEDTEASGATSPAPPRGLVPRKVNQASQLLRGRISETPKMKRMASDGSSRFQNLRLRQLKVQSAELR